MNLNASPDPSAPIGAHFGAAGAISTTFVGGFVAGLEANSVVGPSGIGATINNATIGSTDGTATGTYVYNHTFNPVVPTSTTVTGVSWDGTTATLTGNFTAAEVGDGVTSSSAGLPTGATIESVNPGVSATIQSPTTAAASGATVTLWSAITFTDAAVSIPATTFTTNGTNGGVSNIGLVSQSGISANVNLTIQFGKTSGGEGYGTDQLPRDRLGRRSHTCLRGGRGCESQAPPTASTTLVEATGGFVTQPGVTAGDGITPPAAAFVSLVDNAPTPNNQTVNLGEGGTATGTLTATVGSYPVASYSLVGGSPQTIGGRLTVTLTDPSTGAFSLSDTGATATVLTFQFNACDGQSPAVCSTSPGTITVDIGTPPVIQPFSQQVVGGQLVLSCNSPANYVTPGATPPGPTANPLLQCPTFGFPNITLDGLEQTVTGTTGNAGGQPSTSNPGTIYISDNRGDPTDQWTLTGTFIPTPGPR